MISIQTLLIIFSISIVFIFIFFGHWIMAKCNEYLIKHHGMFVDPMGKVHKIDEDEEKCLEKN